MSGYGGCENGGYGNNSFALIVVLFILLIIVGASFIY
ncbi:MULTISPECIES: YjcZ family sporulation protein [Bacillaceae]|nr:MULTISPECIES: YjcZ family sporulation protein [Bacillaceae]MDF2067050.1 YjcZ family sporulation protein [Bacillus sp. Cr_A10]